MHVNNCHTWQFVKINNFILPYQYFICIIKKHEVVLDYFLDDLSTYCLNRLLLRLKEETFSNTHWYDYLGWLQKLCNCHTPIPSSLMSCEF